MFERASEVEVAQHVTPAKGASPSPLLANKGHVMPIMRARGGARARVRARMCVRVRVCVRVYGRVRGYYISVLQVRN